MRRPYKRRPTVGTTLVPFGDNMVVEGNEQRICSDRIASQFVGHFGRRRAASAKEGGEETEADGDDYKEDLLSVDFVEKFVLCVVPHLL